MHSCIHPRLEESLLNWYNAIDNSQKIVQFRQSMQTSMGRIRNSGKPTSEIVSSEVEFLSEALGNLRDAGQISNDAYLDAGAIQGGLSLIASLLDQGVSIDEIDVQISQLSLRASRICSAHPEIDGQIESFRR